MKTQITKSWRKTLSMRFDAHGVLHVKAPKFMLQYQIDAFIHKNSAWIEKHYTKIQQQKADKKYYLFGGEIAPSVLRTPPSTKEAQEAPSVLRTPPSSKEAYKKKFPLVEGGGNTTELVKFYKTQAKDYIIPRCEALAREHGFQYKGIRITSAVTRWGSCSSKKTLNFSYRLVMAPRECIDYVIIHELCHLRQMNHSHKFWKEVADIMPQYKTCEKHLKNEGWKYKGIEV